MRDKLDRSLRAVLGRGERIILEGGEEWTLYPLLLSDWAELEEYQEAVPPRGNITVSMYICWLSLRRNGSFDGHKWEMTLDDVGIIVPISQIGIIAERIIKISTLTDGKKNGPNDGLGIALVSSPHTAPADPARI